MDLLDDDMDRWLLIFYYTLSKLLRIDRGGAPEASRRTVRDSLPSYVLVVHPPNIVTLRHLILHNWSRSVQQYTPTELYILLTHPTVGRHSPNVYT